MIPSRRDVLRSAAAALAAAATGCGRPARPEREHGRVVVTFWYACGDLVRKVLLDLVARFNAEQGAVVVRAVHQGDYFEALAKLRAALVAGVAPSLTHVVLEVVPYLARAGVLEPLAGYDAVRELPFVPSLAQSGAFSGGGGEPVVALPFNRSTPIVYANARAFDAAGAALPATWEELVAVARRLTVRSPSGDTRWGFESPISWWYWAALVGQAGGTLLDAAGRPTLGGDAGEEAIRFWQRLVHDERVMRPPAGRDYQAWESANESFLQGHVAMIWSSTAYVRYLEAHARFPVVAGPLPRHRRAAVPTGGTMFVVLRSAPADEKRGACAFLRWMAADRQVMEWSTRTGYLPVTRPAFDRLTRIGWYESHPNDLVGYEQLGSVEPWPWAPDLLRIERDIVEPRLERAVLTGADARVVMDEAREEAARPG